MEKSFWSPYEDNILKILRQERKIQRWTDISRTLVDEFKIKGKNGKHCKERYQERFDSFDQNSGWSFKEEKALFTLHNQLGNKWAIISRRMNGRSDNCIKNHFYSKLRKGLKKMNMIAEEKLGKAFKQIKFNVLFKIIEATQDGFKDNRFCEADTSKYCFELKNKLIILSYEEDEQHDYHPEDIDSVELYENINSFTKNYKRKPKRFRRIPTKFEQTKERQSENFQNDSLENKQSAQNQADDQLQDLEISQKDIGQKQAECFYEFKQENYKINQLKNFKKRRESAETVGIETILVGSGILEEQPNLPMLGLTKKRTSYFDFLSQQSDKQNIFFDQCELNTQNFLLKDLLSMKRLSQTDQRFFD